ncbi:MAG: VWA domain-containing protein [Polyangiaceae bacterium]
MNFGRAFWVPLPLLLLAACSTDKEPLKLREAATAICGGGASRQNNGKTNGTGADDSGGVGGGSGGGSTWTGTTTTSWEETGGSVVGGGGSGGSTGCGGMGGMGGMGGCGGSVVGGGGSMGGSMGGSTGGSGGVPAGGAGGMNAAPPRSPMVAEGCSGIDLENPAKLYLSADDSNSMASAAILRRLIHGGAKTVSPSYVRTYEVLNYYQYHFAPPPAGQLSIMSQLGSCALTGDLALQIAVTSPPAEVSRLPLTVTLVLDTSGSMSGEPIELERAAVKAIASTLLPGDVVSAVTWSTEQSVLLDGYTVSGANDPALISLADGLAADGGTDLDSGLTRGYELANAYRGSDRINRVILISDGQANVGVTAADLIGKNAEDQDAEGIYLVGVGVGDGVNDTLMDTVTDAGRGAYIYLDTQAEASKMFVDRFSESVLVAARDVRIELTLPPYFGIKKFYGEEYSPDPTKVRTQHLAPNDSMMLYQIIHPCDPGLPSANDPYKVVVTWKDPVNGESKSTTQDTTLGQLGIDDGNLSKAAAIIAYTEALKELEGASEASRVTLLQDAKTFVASVDPNGTDPDLVEIQDLLSALISNNGG